FKRVGRSSRINFDKWCDGTYLIGVLEDDLVRGTRFLNLTGLVIDVQRLGGNDFAKTQAALRLLGFANLERMGRRAGARHRKRRQNAKFEDAHRIPPALRRKRDDSWLACRMTLISKRVRSSASHRALA